MNNSAYPLKYLEIYDSLRNDILMKVYPGNTLFPGEMQLMKTYGVSRNTVRRALKQLQDEHYIVTQRGVGSLVCYETLSQDFHDAAPSWHASHTHLDYYVPVEKMQMSPPVVDKVVPPSKVLEAMKLPPETTVVRLSCFRLINGITCSYNTQYINPEILPDFDQYVRYDQTNRVAALMKKHYGYKQLRTMEYVSCINADFVVANLLNVDPGAAVEYSMRVAECEKGVFECGIFHSNPAYIGYKITIDIQDEDA